MHDYLKSQDSHTLHYPVRKNFRRNRVVVTAPDEQWGADLTDFQSIASENRGYAWILCVCDAFSKFGFVRCLKNKTAACVLEGLKDIFASTERRPTQVLVDNGSEFLRWPAYLKGLNIQFITVNNPDIKVSYCEKYQLTLKRTLFKAFTHRQSYNYVDGLLDDIVHAYNNTYHRSIKMAPNEVTEERVLECYRNLYGMPFLEKPVKPRLRVGATVRITREMGPFEKSVYGGWSEELYEVTQVVPHTIPVYRLKLLTSGEPITGTFYAYEVQEVNRPPPNSPIRGRRAAPQQARVRPPPPHAPPPPPLPTQTSAARRAAARRASGRS